MDINAIKNKLITYMNYNNLKLSLIKEIQDALLYKDKKSDFEQLLQKVEAEIANLNKKNN